MAKLIYSAITSLDEYVEDADGSFDWAAPDDEVLSYVNDLERPIGTYLYGRRMYETMVYWETSEVTRDQSPSEWDFTQLWRAADKIVYSSSLHAASSARTSIKRGFDADEVRAMKATHDRDITVGGAELAAQAFAAGLVDECQLLLTPVIVGGGKRALPSNLRLDLNLIDQRRFENGVVFLRYRVT